MVAQGMEAWDPSHQTVALQSREHRPASFVIPNQKRQFVFG